MADMQFKTRGSQPRKLSMAQPKDDQRFSQDKLFRLMSEVIALREQVAQAELAWVRRKLKSDE